MAAEYETLALDDSYEDILVVSLNRPDAANAINTQMGVDLADVWESLALDSGKYRCAVLAAAGDRAFCAGGDLKERNRMSDEQWRVQHKIYERMMRAFGDCPVPMIAAVNGPAYGGGCEIALACDFAYASTAARFALTEVKLGIMPGSGGTQNLPRAIGQRRAMEVLLTGDPVSAEQALEWGMVNKLVEPKELFSTVLETATRIANNAPISTRQIKNAVRQGMQMDIRSGMLFELQAYNRCVPTEDRLEGVLAFNKKRSARFKGR